MKIKNESQMTLPGHASFACSGHIGSNDVLQVRKIAKSVLTSGALMDMTQMMKFLLHQAAKRGDLELVRTMLDKQTDKNLDAGDMQHAIVKQLREDTMKHASRVNQVL